MSSGLLGGFLSFLRLTIENIASCEVLSLDVIMIVGSYFEAEDRVDHYCGVEHEECIS